MRASENSTWSFLKSVGLNHASTPFAKRTTVTPSSGISRREVTAAGSGTCSISVVLDAQCRSRRSPPRTSVAASAALSWTSVGTARFAFCGDTARITRL